MTKDLVEEEVKTLNQVVKDEGPIGGVKVMLKGEVLVLI